MRWLAHAQWMRILGSPPRPPLRLTLSQSLASLWVVDLRLQTPSHATQLNRSPQILTFKDMHMLNCNSVFNQIDLIFLTSETTLTKDFVKQAWCLIFITSRSVSHFIFWSFNFQVATLNSSPNVNRTQSPHWHLLSRRLWTERICGGCLGICGICRDIEFEVCQTPNPIQWPAKICPAAHLGISVQFGPKSLKSAQNLQTTETWEFKFIQYLGCRFLPRAAKNLRCQANTSSHRWTLWVVLCLGCLGSSLGGASAVGSPLIGGQRGILVKRDQTILPPPPLLGEFMILATFWHRHHLFDGQRLHNTRIKADPTTGGFEVLTLVTASTWESIPLMLPLLSPN